MTTINTTAADVTFRVRPLGFDRGEVQAFIGNLLNDYAQVTRELDRLRNEMTAMRDFPGDRKPLPEIAQVVAPVAPVSAASSSAREVERILAGAERIADEIRARAQEETDALMREAQERAAVLLHDAETKSTDTLKESQTRSADTLKDAQVRSAEILKDAQTRASEIVEGAVQHSEQLDRQSAMIRAHFTQMRTSIKSASDAAALALKQIAAIDDEHEPALHAKRA